MLAAWHHVILAAWHFVARRFCRYPPFVSGRDSFAQKLRGDASQLARTAIAAMTRRVFVDSRWNWQEASATYRSGCD
jgi:hypothetical protein